MRVVRLQVWNSGLYLGFAKQARARRLSFTAPEKAELARANGCDHPVLYNEEDFSARIKALTDGKGVDVVYDSVGQATFMKSLDCLRPMGMMVSFGQASGPLTPFDTGLLAQKGALFLTRPTLMIYPAKQR